MLPLSVTAVEIIVVKITRLASVTIPLSLLIALVSMLVTGAMVLVLFPARGGFPVP